MSWILCNTRADRLAVDFMSAASIADIEDAEGILEDIMIMFFPGREAETIDEMDAAQIGRSIRAAAHMLSHALTRYHCNLGHYDNPRVEAFQLRAERCRKVCEAERLHDEAEETGCTAEGMYMDDERAIEFYREIIARKSKP